MLLLDFVKFCAVQDLLPRANRWQNKPLKIVDGEKTRVNNIITLLANITLSSVATLLLKYYTGTNNFLWENNILVIQIWEHVHYAHPENGGLFPAVHVIVFHPN